MIEMVHFVWLEKGFLFSNRTFNRISLAKNLQVEADAMYWNEHFTWYLSIFFYVMFVCIYPLAAMMCGYEEYVNRIYTIWKEISLKMNGNCNDRKKNQIRFEPLCVVQVANIIQSNLCILLHYSWSTYGETHAKFKTFKNWSDRMLKLAIK